MGCGVRTGFSPSRLGFLGVAVRKERRQLTKAELATITSRQPVLQRSSRQGSSLYLPYLSLGRVTTLGEMSLSKGRSSFGVYPARLEALEAL